MATNIIAFVDLSIIQTMQLNKEMKKKRRKYIDEEKALMMLIGLLIYTIYAFYYDINFMIKPGVDFFFQGFIYIFGFLALFAILPVTLALWSMGNHLDDYVQVLFGYDLKYIYHFNRHPITKKEE